MFGDHQYVTTFASPPLTRHTNLFGNGYYVVYRRGEDHSNYAHNEFSTTKKLVEDFKLLAHKIRRRLIAAPLTKPRPRNPRPCARAALPEPHDARPRCRTETVMIYLLLGIIVSLLLWAIIEIIRAVRGDS